MRNCCGNPGVGDTTKDIADEPIYKTYNPSEVRLYGRPATDPVTVTVIKDEFLKSIKKLVEEDSNYKKFFKANENEFWGIFDKVIKYTESKVFLDGKMITIVNRNNIVISITYQKDENSRTVYSLPISVNLPWLSYGDDATNYIKSFGVIYGYAYEGHCYKMRKPQLMLLPEIPRKIDEAGCDCDCGYSPNLGYAVWQIDKLQRAVALDVRSDDLKTLVLDENMPGSRSPQAYAQSMVTAPQRMRE